jgi:cbb3-type cytochrome oxidase subunit 3
MELILIVLVVAGLIWFVMRGRRRAAADDEATLTRAWRIVLDDPNYKQRRDVEERRRALEDEAR